MAWWKRIRGKIWPSFLFFMGAAALVAGVFGVAQILEWNAWPHTQAIVIDQKQSQDCGRTSGCQWVYQPVVQYTVNGQQYTYDASNAVTLNRSTTTYTLGQKVTVSYDANNPGNAVVAGTTTPIWALIFMLLFGGGMIWLARAIWPKRPDVSQS